MTLRLTEEETEILRALAAQEGRSMQEVVRLAVLDRATHSAHTSQVDALLDSGTQRYADLLDRLSQ